MCRVSSSVALNHQRRRSSGPWKDAAMRLLWRFIVSDISPPTTRGRVGDQGRWLCSDSSVSSTSARLLVVPSALARGFPGKPKWPVCVSEIVRPSFTTDSTQRTTKCSQILSLLNIILLAPLSKLIELLSFIL